MSLVAEEYRTCTIDCTFYVRCMKTTTARCRPDQRAAVPVPHRIILYNLEKSFGGGGVEEEEAARCWSV